jgi:hypothetical protein
MTVSCLRSLLKYCEVQLPKLVCLASADTLNGTGVSFVSQILFPIVAVFLLTTKKYGTSWGISHRFVKLCH